MKVGDRVRYTRDNSEWVIESIDNDPHYPVNLLSDGGTEGAAAFRDLEVIEKETAMTKNIAMIANSTGLTVAIGTDVHTIAKDHPNFEAIQEAYAEQRVDDLETLVSVRKSIETFAAGTDLRIEGDALYYGDRELKTGLARRILQLMREGKEAFAKPLVAFMENVLQNPSFRAVEGLYEWLEKSNLPITPDGHFIAWKMVRDDYKDIRTGTFDNSVGAVVEIPRNQCDENPDQTCSYGLHFCSNDYLDSGYARGDRTVMVKVNPADVVAFPHDYNTSKGRCCRYEVIEEVTREEAKTRFTKTPTAVYDSVKRVARLGTSNTERAEIILEFTDGTTQRTKRRLGDTVSFEQKGNQVTLQPSGRVIMID